MLMEIHPREDTKSKKHAKEALECNIHFYSILRELGVIPQFVHTDKDFCEISASQVTSPSFGQRIKLILQSPNVWPEAIISLCSWHAERAVLKYLQTNNQSPWAAGHAIIDYHDTDRERKWDDACEFDTAWVQERNLERENLFRM